LNKAINKDLTSP